MARVTDTLGLVRWIRRIQKLQDAVTKEYTNRIIDYYKNKTLKTIVPKVNALKLRLETEPEITPNGIKKTAEYKDLITSAADELDNFAEFATIQLDLSSKASVAQAVQDVIALGAIINLDKTKIVTPSAIEILRDYLAEDGQLIKRINMWAGEATAKVVNDIIEGVSLGRNPVKIARLLYKDYGVALSDAIRAVRTVQLWSYREATRANYIANADIIQGWVWYSAMDGRTCMSCLAMHGTVHPLTESLDDHPNGRCTMLPYPFGMEVIEQTGQEWFDGRSEEEQIKMMGPQIHQAYKGGAFKFEEFTKQTTNDVYGSFRVQRPLWELLGAESPNYK